jgi:hypothetical protein
MSISVSELARQSNLMRVRVAFFAAQHLPTASSLCCLFKKVRDYGDTAFHPLNFV